MQSIIRDYDINAKGEDDETALVKAVKKGHTEVVKTLLSYNPDVNVCDGGGYTALIHSATHGHTEIVKALLKTPGIDVNHARVSFHLLFSPILPVMNNHSFYQLCCCYFLQAAGWTALLSATFNGHTECVEALLAAPGINVNHANHDGHTAIDFAKTEDLKEILINPSGFLFCYAAEAGDLVKVQSMVSTVDVNCVGINGETAVFKACKSEHVHVVEFLASHGADVNIANIQGFHPIDVAAEKAHVEMIKVLAAHGAQLDKPLHMTAETKNLEAVIALINVGADVSMKNKQGKTCLDLLSAKNKLTVLTKMSLDLSLLQAHNYALWFVIVQEDGTSGGKVFNKLLTIVETLLSRNSTLAAAKDADGRAAVDVASKPMKLIMQSVLLWHGRYRIIESRPEHISATCFVFKAVDEHTVDKDTGLPIKVALKLMRLKDQFQREISTRDKGFNHQHVMHILQTHPQVGSSTFDNWPDEVVDVEADGTGQLTKTNAEKLYMLLMPLADRNLFVALKQERWAGKNMEEVRHVFTQLVHCVEHMHGKGVLHADLKTLNIVRTAGQWKLIDLDASCVIGKEHVGHKSSSAYIPPEAIYVDEKADTACVRSAMAVTKGEANYELLTAHPSFDVWSLGCILYQMCTPDVKPLLQGGQDDNLVGMRKGIDNLFSLAEWSSELKADKLADVPDQLARNLLSQMLHKDPLHRPSLARVLAHPFLSGKKVARLVGEKPKYDVFLSYRVASDLLHVEKLYNSLTAQGFKVYWDKNCLEPGVDWEQGFCEGLVSSRAFVPLLSRDAINHAEKAWQNFSQLTADSNCDNVFLEHRLAVELQGLGLIDKIFPIFIGNLDATTSEYSHYFGSGCHPTLLEVAVKSVEEKLRHHMESQALGTPLVPDRTVKSVMDAITGCQGAFIVGPADATFAAATASIAKMLTDVPIRQSQKYGNYSFLNTMQNKTLVAENTALKEKVDGALESLRSGQFTSIEELSAHMEALLQGE